MYNYIAVPISWLAFAANLPAIFWISHIICWWNDTAASRLLSTLTSAGTSLVAVCYSNKSVVKASSSIISSILSTGEAGNSSDGPSELSSKDVEN